MILNKADLERDRNFKPMSLEEIKNDYWLREIMLKGLESQFLDPYIKGQEAYFGPTSPLPQCFLKYVKQIRVLFEQTMIGGAAAQPQNKKDLYKHFESTVESMEKELTKILNAEQVTVGLILDTNAFSLPMCWDYNLTRVNGKKKFNNELKISLEDLVEAKDGIKFKTKDGKHVIIAMGLGLFPQCSDEEIVAIMLHELGHTFQHMLVTINGNVCNYVRKNAIQMLWLSLNPIYMVLSTLPALGPFAIFVAIFSFILSGFIWILERAVAKNIKEEGEEKAGREMMMNMFDKTFERQYIANEVIQMRTDSVKAAIKSKETNIFIKIMLGIFRFIFDTVNVALYATLGPIVSLVLSIPSHAVVMGYWKYLKKERRYEQFADMFATQYGYGPYLASGLSKITGYMGQDFGVYNFLHYIPVLNVWLNTSKLIDAHAGLLMAGYPPTKERIESLYASLDYELAKNSKLTANQKKEIKRQMADIEDTFMNYVYSKDAKNTVYRLFNKIRNADIKNNNKTDVVANVLEPLYELREELITDSLSNKEDFIDPKTRKPKPRLALPLASLMSNMVDKLALNTVYKFLIEPDINYTMDNIKETFNIKNFK